MRRLSTRVANRGRRWLNRIVYRWIGGNDRPVFHDPKKVCPELLGVDENYDDIRAELDRVLEMREQLPLYHNVDSKQQEISGSDERAWRTFFLYARELGEEFPNQELCPRTTEVVKSIPGVLQAFFSVLEPRKCVPAHEGPSFTYLRYHTGFRIPRQNPPSIRVRDQHYTWKERESVLFDDSWNHEVTNHADEVRVVLIVDIERPLPWFLRAPHIFLRRLSVGNKEEGKRAFADMVRPRATQ